MTRATAEIDTEISDGKPVIRVKIDTEGNLGEFSEPNIPSYRCHGTGGSGICPKYPEQ